MRSVVNTSMKPTAWWNSRITGLLLDRFEQIVIAGLYCWFVLRLFQHFTAGGAWVNLLMLPSEGLVLFFILIRRRSENVSRRWTDWVLAVCGSAAPLLVVAAAGRNLAAPAVAGVLVIMGIFVQVHAKLVLRRSFGCVAANRGLKSSGPYRFVRHPMYLGYLLSHIGFLLMNATLWNLSVYVFCYCMQIPRIFAEERMLREDRQYGEYSRRVPCRLVPGVF